MQSAPITAPPTAREPESTALRPGKNRFGRLARAALIWGSAVAAVVALALGIRAAVNRKESPVQYQTTPIDQGGIAAKITATGALSAIITVSVGSQVSGRIQALYADFGSQVTEGQVVAKIEPSLFQAAVAQAQANRSAALSALARATAQSVNADRQYARTKSLHAEGLATTADLDTNESALGVARADINSARSAVEQANAALEQAKLNLHYTTIVSPIDGVVISRNVDVGQTVAATLQAPTLFTIAQDLTRMQVDTNVAEADVGRVHPGMDVTFKVDAYPLRIFHGTIRQVRDNAQTIQNVVTYDAVIDVDNSERLLKPGMTANVTAVYAEKANVVRLPNAALRFMPDRATLAAMQTGPLPQPSPSKPDERLAWIMRQGRGKPELVRIGISDGTWTEVVEGDAHPGDLAVVEATTNISKQGP